MIPLGVVTGLRAEARLAEDAGLIARVAGGDATCAQACAERLAAEGARVLVSFGLAGGLDPALAPGTLVIADDVIDGTHRRATDPTWTGRLRGVLAGAVGGAMIGVGVPLATTPAKAAARAATGAVAVDTESHAVARVAQAHGLPFIVVRAIVDGATMALPPAALAALGCDGRIALGRVAASVIARPAQMPGLVRLARAHRRAMASLRRAATALSGLPTA
ncbi:MAG: phosphorylase [Alphaproteobacteria bacterium]